MTSPDQTSIRFVRKHKRLKHFSKDSPNAKIKGIQPEILGKAKIEGDKLPQVTNSLVESLNSRDSLERRFS